jgi:hypothetical protein
MQERIDLIKYLDKTSPPIVYPGREGGFLGMAS